MFAEQPRPSSVPVGFLPPKPARAARRRKGTAPPDSADAIAAPLLEYLWQRSGVCGLHYAVPPSPAPDGWETYIYTFRLEGPGLSAEWDRPLLLRIHANRRALPRVRHEFEVQRHLSELGYPAPRPILLEESCGLFGGPFLLMEQIAGPTLLDVMLRQPWHFLRFPSQMAEAHAHLHSLPARGFHGLPGSFLRRQLREMGTATRRHDLAGLKPGLEWLRRHRPAEPEVPSILHLDFHPLNLIEGDDGTLSVLDWTYADVGDPHADVAATLLLLECGPVRDKSLWHRLTALVGRPIVSGWYHHTYHRERPLDEDRLSYYRAWAAMRQLVRYGGWLKAGPEADGCKRSVVEHLDEGLLHSVCHYFRRWADVEVRL